MNSRERSVNRLHDIWNTTLGQLAPTVRLYVRELSDGDLEDLYALVYGYLEPYRNDDDSNGSPFEYECDFLSIIKTCIGAELDYREALEKARTSGLDVCPPLEGPIED